MRASLVKEFSSVHVLNLRGDARTSGELRRSEGDNVFGQGSRASVAITILVRNPNAAHEGCHILYHDIGDYLKREEKLEILRKTESISGIKDWQEITPDRYNDWIGQRDEAFQVLYPLGSKEAKAAKTGELDEVIFKLYSNGYKSGRDAYIYNFSRNACAENARAMVGDYLGAMQFHAKHPEYTIEEVVQKYSSHAHWDGKLESLNQRQVMTHFSIEYIREVSYRTLCKTVSLC